MSEIVNADAELLMRRAEVEALRLRCRRLQAALERIEDGRPEDRDARTIAGHALSTDDKAQGK